ncbi:MAG: GGDEF domain-containing protein [Candidatus Omnitrophica bacterium]|nr:GGDEF domain-containing protein [Candidatus Omnitrophota bacterium]
MLKHSLIFAGFILLVAAVAVQAGDLFLSYYVLFPSLVFPFFYFFVMPSAPFLSATAVVTAVFYGFYLYGHPTLEMALLLVLFILILGGLFYFQQRLNSELDDQTRESSKVHAELMNQKQKYQSRLESLHHLEKQVSSLMDLFEIARDFNDCLSFEAIADLLHKRILPQLPFEWLALVLLDKNEESDSGDVRSLKVTAEGVRDEKIDLSVRDREILNQIQLNKQMIRQDREWIFPLVAEGRVNALLRVKGADDNDLAKFEVLAAHLLLQVKKVRLYEEVRELSITDSLTNVFVRRHFLERFEDELKRCSKYHLPLALLMLDIDHFKRYNDDFGHLVGDATLKEVAVLLRANLRHVDIIARYGGEEFIVVIPEARREGAHEIAERIRSSIARHHFKVYGVETRVTVSIGIALFTGEEFPQSADGTNSAYALELIRRADKALYRAKEEGRNRVVFYQDF